MGSYDTVRLLCPECGTEIQEQTKSGPCRQAVYWVGSAPIELLAGIKNHKIQCPNCKADIAIHIHCLVTIATIPKEDPECQ